MSNQADLLGPKVEAKVLASEANYSVAQFYRRFARETGGAPQSLRRRILLERAAFELTRTLDSIADVALRARFNSFEGFSPAFKRKYGVTPRQYRSLAATDYRLDPSQALHFAPSNRPDAHRQGALTMNVLDRLIGSHYLHMKILLERCETLTDAQLDQPIPHYYDPLPWMRDPQSIRSLLRHIIGDGSPFPGVQPKRPHDTSTLPGLKAALEESYPKTRQLIAEHEREGLWDLTFVDAACEPPMVFSYGGWIGHVIVFQNYRRLALLKALQDIGVEALPYCDPIDYQGDGPESIAPWSLLALGLTAGVETAPDQKAISHS